MSRLLNKLLDMVLAHTDREKPISASLCQSPSSPSLYSSPEESSTVSLYFSDSRASWTTSGRLRGWCEETWRDMAGMGGGGHRNHNISRCLGGEQSSGARCQLVMNWRIRWVSRLKQIAPLWWEIWGLEYATLALNITKVCDGCRTLLVLWVNSSNIHCFPHLLDTI